MKKPLATMKNGDLVLTKKGRLLAILATTFVLFTTALGGYAYIHHQEKSSVMGTITTTVTSKHQSKHVIDITKLSSDEIQKIANNAKSKGYTTIHVLVMSNHCQRCKNHKSELSDEVVETANDKNLVLIADFSNKTIKQRLEVVFHLPTRYYYPTIVAYQLNKQEKHGRQDVEYKREGLDYWRVKPLFQNKSPYVV